MPNFPPEYYERINAKGPQNKQMASIRKDILKPILEPIGFKKKAHYFYRCINEVVQAIHIQKDKDG